MIAVEFKDFSFQYRAQSEPTLKHIDLQIKKGEKVLIAGPSGSGKSTIGHCINGLIPHYYRGNISGELFVEEQDALKKDIFALSKLVGTVLQDSDGQFVGLTVGEDIAFALENDCVPQDEMIERVRKVAEMVTIKSHLGAGPQSLSGGQKQRVALGGVLVDNVGVLLFDEPLANLDPATGKYAIELIDELSEETDAAIIVIEHRLEDVLWRRMDRIVLMNEGEIICDDTPDHILASGILRQAGIREPLYVTALSYAGVNITPEMRPAQLKTMEPKRFADALQTWTGSILPAPEPAFGDEIISLSHVGFAYSEETPQVLNDISFSIRRGEMTALVGKNGAGKSTLCKLICGFIQPTSGTIRLKGEDAAGISIFDRAKSVGYVMQNPNQMISKAMIREEVGLGLELRDVPKAEIDQRVDEALNICGLYPFRNWPISALSYGQKKRVTIASILVLQPDLILLDEPTAGQDYRHYTEIMEFLLKLQQQGQTILLVTHDMHLMLEYARRAIVIADGHLISDGSPVLGLTDGKIIEAANLKETSLFTLAKEAGIADPYEFVQRFISFERMERERKNG